MSDFAEQQTELVDSIAKINSDIAGTTNFHRKATLEAQLKDTRKELDNLREHHAVMTKPIGPVLKDNGLNDNMPNNSDFVDERLQAEMIAAADAGDIETYKHLRNQRKKLKAGKGPGGVLIGTDPRSVTYR